MVDIPVLHFHDHVPDGTVCTFRITVGQLAADHALDDPVFAEFIHTFYQRLDGRAVADDGRLVGTVDDFI